MANVSGKKDKNQNIQVFVRLRPLNNRERDLKSLGVVEVCGSREVLVRQSVSDSRLSKKFSFDRVFGPASKQIDVYQDVVSPLIEEVLAGYNCTVFAYGQTGTGKTHTMVGESSGNSDIHWQNDPLSGIIPRALSQLFDELRITNAEYTVRVSYLELYNEELFDLLSSTEDNSKLRIYEDVTRKGSNIVNGLEEVTVYNKNEVYKIMAKGQEKRRMATTLMNAQSSRSHTVFTIVVHMKENSPEGEELMKIGKLNLVDLAGSENISKAGTDNPSKKERARECVNINQSLLTLGRVITALVERHPHIPYRESKLTRLLQESLGGRTKTSIIATISPGHRDVEETLSTLEYAFRARNIQNKPEINQKMTKKAVLKEYSEEIDRLKRDLQATRERNGIYLANETYCEMQLKIEEQDKEIQEQILYIKAMKEEKDRLESVFNDMSENLKQVENELSVTNKNLDQTKIALKEKKKDAEEQRHLVQVQVETEKKLTHQANNLLEVTQQTTNDINYLHNTVEKKKALENNNLDTIKNFSDKSQNIRIQIKEYLNEFANSHTDDLSSLQNCIESHHNVYMNTQITVKSVVDEMFGEIREILSTSELSKENYKTKVFNCADEGLERVKDSQATGKNKIDEKMQILLELLAKLDIARENDRQSMEQMKEYVLQWKNASTAKMISLRHAQSEWCENINNHLKTIMELHNQNTDNVTQNNKKFMDLRRDYEEDINSDMNKLKELIIAMEHKHNNHKNILQTMEVENINSFDNSQKQFVSVLDSGNRELNSKIENVNDIVDTFDQINKTSIKDISVMVADYKARIELGKSIDNEIKSSQIEITNVTEQSFMNCVNDTAHAFETIKYIQEQTLTDQEKLYSNLLSKCCDKSDQIVHPLQTTIESIPVFVNANNEELIRLKSNTDKFNDKMFNELSNNDLMENQFLKQEYKLYSPTGKTPVRKDYAYPRTLAVTSPHERILTRWRVSKNKQMATNTSSPIQEDAVINLDQTLEMTPLKRVSNHYQNDSSISIVPTALDDSVFVEPKPVDKQCLNSNVILKAQSEGDLYTLTNKECKENKESLSNEKMSRLRQPLYNKKVLGNKNT